MGGGRSEQHAEALRDRRAPRELRGGQAHAAPAVGGEHEVALAVGLDRALVAVVWRVERVCTLSRVNSLHPAILAPIAQRNNAQVKRKRAETPASLPSRR
jgi:hypothetical protein